MKNLFARKLSTPADFQRVWGQVKSPDGQRTAFRGQRGKQYFVVVDGVCGKGYEDSGVNPPVFSPDSQHIAYSMKQHRKQFIVLDGKEGLMLDEIVDGPAFVQKGDTPLMTAQQGIVFSPDSRRLAYAGWIGDGAVVVVDNRISVPCRQIGMIGLYFSPDSQHLAYAALKGDSWYVVVDGKTGFEYQGIGQTGLTFEADGKTVSFRGLLNDTWRTVKQPF
jgi:hypothetical protein